MASSVPLDAGGASNVLPFRAARPGPAREPERILLSPPQLAGTEAAELQAVLDSGWIAPAGPALARFEAAVAEATGFPFALATASGTAALHLGYRLLGVEPGDEVWTSALTFVATVAPAVQMGAVPRFLDVDPASWTLDPGLLREELAAAAARGRLPRAVVPADLFGQPADLSAIREACEPWGVPVLSDSACGLGGWHRGLQAGRPAGLAAFSFNGNKIVTAGGGGALVSDDRRVIERARALALQAREPAVHYEHETTGHTYAMPSLLAAVGLAQLPQLAARVEARRAVFERYRAALSDLPGLSFMPEPGWARSTRWLSVALFDPALFGADREAVRTELARRGIESRPVWKPLHLQPAFRRAPRAGGAVAARLFAEGLCLPSGGAMTAAEQGRVIAAVRACHRRGAT
jgi:dTDP-4-amino-4,6-dideoxygalactose transaminase